MKLSLHKHRKAVEKNLCRLKFFPKGLLVTQRNEV